MSVSKLDQSRPINGFLAPTRANTAAFGQLAKGALIHSAYQIPFKTAQLSARLRPRLPVRSTLGRCFLTRCHSKNGT